MRRARPPPPPAQITTFTDWSRGYPMAAIQHRADMPFVAVTSGFAFLSAFAHLVVLARFQVYKDDLRRGRNVFRWFEYAASSSLLIGERERASARARARPPRAHAAAPPCSPSACALARSLARAGLIAQLFGVYDVLLLVALMSVNACMNLFGLLHEVLNEGREPQRVDW